MSDKLHIEQLFRARLGEAELTPSQGTWKGIRRKLRWRQFLRFQPGRFNVYYAGALVLAAAVTVMLLQGEKQGKEQVDMLEEEITTSPGRVEVHESETMVAPSEKEDESEKTVTSPEVREQPQVEPTGRSDAEMPDKEKPEAERPELEDPDPKTPEQNPETGPGKILENNAMIPTVVPIEDEPVEGRLPITDFSSSLQSGCVPMEVQFTNHSVNAASWEWSFGTGEGSQERDPVYVFTEPGRYAVTLTARNQDGQTTTLSRMIEVWPKPAAEFRIEEGLEGTDNHVVLNLLNYSSAASYYTWCLVDENGINCSQWSSPEFQPSLQLNRITPDSRSVQLMAITDLGCSDTARVILPLKVESSEVKIKFATAFSPNPSGPGDGSFTPQSRRIDLFHPIYVDVPAEYRMRIFTRRGELVFETREIYKGWDGYIQQEQAVAGVYVWMVDGKYSDGQPFSYHGDVTLVKHNYW